MAMIGNADTKRQIEIAVNAAKTRNAAPPHMLFSGHAGCGKTSMGKEFSIMLGTDFIPIIPETLKDQKSIMELVDSLNYEGYDEMGNRVGDIRPSVVFLDECHNLPMYGQEKLGIIMENFTMETGQKNKLYWIPYFTVIGATTLAGELSKPFLDRFKLNFFFEPYIKEESALIVHTHADRLGIKISEAAARDIANRARGIPRIIVRYLERCSDMSQSIGSDLITSALAKATFDIMGIDNDGYNKIELKILGCLYNSDKPIGLETLSVVTGESVKTIKNELETYLIRSGMMVRSGAGRLITGLGREYLEEKGYVGKRQGRVAISPTYERK